MKEKSSLSSSLSRRAMVGGVPAGLGKSGGHAARPAREALRALRQRTVVPRRLSVY